jgi:hypothetical protein
MKIGIPSLYVTECRHIKVTKDAGTESEQIDFDNGVFVVMATGKPELARDSRNGNGRIEPPIAAHGARERPINGNRITS